MSHVPAPSATGTLQLRLASKNRLWNTCPPETKAASAIASPMPTEIAGLPVIVGLPLMGRGPCQMTPFQIIATCQRHRRPRPAACGARVPRHPAEHAEDDRRARGPRRDVREKVFTDFKQAQQAATILLKLYNVFMDDDCSLAEINPLAVTPEGRVIALDAKVVLDDNADFRHRDWDEHWRDPADESQWSRLAREKGLSYVKLDGDIGCVVNGAGLAMATMDLIKHYGGEPANFLDIGGSSNPEKVTAALKIITNDGHVRAILFNIFGGITRCDDVANGIVASLKESPLPVPLVIRLTGTNEEKARQILSDFGLGATTSMDEAVQMVIAKAQEVNA